MTHRAAESGAVESRTACKDFQRLGKSPMLDRRGVRRFAISKQLSEPLNRFRLLSYEPEIVYLEALISEP